ncbi:DUF6478 family protein [Paracoccus sp. p4-l81]|uniref:DUF6478 family protein n=1 Tax=Paracoccus sp. p4-l81 TaxID=3342806 RepID=UPI0035B8C779
MTVGESGLFARLIRDRLQRRWHEASERVDDLPMASLRRANSDARRLRQLLDRFMSAAQPRLLASYADPVVADLPLGTDAVWRPAPWRGPLSPSGRVAADNAAVLCDGVSLHHDCPLQELILRQVPVLRADGQAPYAVRIETLGFAGSFLSLAIQLAPELIEGLRRDHLMRLMLLVQTERPMQIYARLNIRHGPNVEQVLRALPGPNPARPGHPVLAEFDLSECEINEKRVESGWLDLILERPQMNAVHLSDLVMMRFPRADL